MIGSVAMDNIVEAKQSTAFMCRSKAGCSSMAKTVPV